MKKISFRLLSCLLTVFTLLPVFSAAAQSASANGDEVMIDVYQEHEIFYEDHVGENLASLTAGNDTVHTSNGKTPINNLYDLKIVGSGYTPFTTFETSSKNLKLLGNHASENTSKNVFTLDNIDDRTAGKGMVTVIPESYMKDLEEFTIYWINRVHKPKSGYIGLALFYDNMETVDGVDYFNGYDNYTYTGFTGNMMNSYAAYSIYDGKKVSFATESMNTTHPEQNTSIYASVTCIKGDYEYNGVKYTAKILSYVDDQLVSTSYAQWADAPVMFLYENDSNRWCVQFTNVKLKAKLPEKISVNTMLESSDPLVISGTSVRYEGGAGLRFYTELNKDSLYDNATAVETGVIMIESDQYKGELNVDTEGILKSENPCELQNTDLIIETTHDFLDPSIAGKSFIARAYVKYDIQGKTFYDYTAVEKASCARTAAKVVNKIENSAETAVMIDACSKLAGPLTAIDMMTLNILVPGTGSEKDTERYGTLNYEQRMESAIHMIKELSPDVLGVQELSTGLQLPLLRADADLSERYGIVDSADDTLQSGGSGEEGLCILYKKDRFELISTGVKYLSDTPDVKHSLFAEAAAYNAGEGVTAKFYPRKVLYAVLREKHTQQEFAFCVTHLAYTASDTDLDQTVRNKQAAKLIELIESGALFDASIPYAIVGDMNAKPNTEAYNLLLKTTEDIRYVADQAASATQGTIHNFKANYSGSSIDHIFISQADFYANLHEIVTKEYFSASLGKNILPSDHYAVMGRVTFLPD